MRVSINVHSACKVKTLVLRGLLYALRCDFTIVRLATPTFTLRGRWILRPLTLANSLGLLS